MLINTKQENIKKQIAKMSGRKLWDKVNGWLKKEKITNKAAINMYAYWLRQHGIPVFASTQPMTVSYTPKPKEKEHSMEEVMDIIGERKDII